MPLATLDRPRPVAASRGESPAPGGLKSRLAHPSVYLFVILTAQLMVVLDSTIVNVALPSIQRGLGFSSGGLSWVLNAYILTFGGLLLLGARAGDLLGRRRAFLGGIALFTLSSLAGGLAIAGWMLLAARALQGIGAALAAPSALSLLTAAFPQGPQRVRAIALYTTMSAAGGATGLVAGGLLTQLLSWRWVMFVNVPIGAAVWAIGALALSETRRRQGRFDFAGALTSTLGMTGIVLGLVEAGSEGWGRTSTVAPLALGIALLVLFVVNETRVEEPILPLRLLAHTTRSSANLARGLLSAGMYGSFFFLSQFLQDVQGYTPLRAGVAFLPWPASLFLASQLTSRVLTRRLSQRAVLVSGIVTAIAGLLLVSRLGVGTPYLELVVSLVLIGAGMGVAFVALTTASLTDVEAEDAGAASGLINVSQQVGGALGLAVLVTVFDAGTGHAQLRLTGGAISARVLAHLHILVIGGLHDVFELGVALALVALAVVGVGLRRRERVTAAASRVLEAEI
jgi:EmrB/QacA subfamily drug resistance transporter